MKLKLFENFENIEFEETIKRNSLDVDIYDAPLEYKGASVMGGKVKWILDLYTRRSGYETGLPKLTYLYLMLEVEDEENEDTKEIQIEVTKDEFDWEQFSSEVKQFPLYLREIEIEMNHTKDPEFWKYKLIIGSEED